MLVPEKTLFYFSYQQYQITFSGLLMTGHVTWSTHTETVKKKPTSTSPSANDKVSIWHEIILYLYRGKHRNWLNYRMA